MSVSPSGLACRINTFDVSLAPGEPVALQSVNGSRRGRAGGRCKSLNPEPGYAAAVALEGCNLTLTYYALDVPSIIAALPAR
jgi:hypothetical protein